MDTVKIDKKAIVDLMRLREEFDNIVESIELMGDNEFMESYKKSKEQVAKKEFADWNAL